MHFKDNQEVFWVLCEVDKNQDNVKTIPSFPSSKETHYHCFPCLKELLFLISDCLPLFSSEFNSERVGKMVQTTVEPVRSTP